MSHAGDTALAARRLEKLAVQLLGRPYAALIARQTEILERLEAAGR